MWRLYVGLMNWNPKEDAMSKKSPIQFLIENKAPVFEAYERNGKNYVKTWENLLETLPDLSKAMRLNTFKQYMAVFSVFVLELDKVTQERDRAIRELKDMELRKAKLETRVEEFKKKLDKVTQKEIVKEQVTHKLHNQPKRIAGWSIQKAKDGYYRCYRKVANKVYSIYIGKTFDAEKAHRRIIEKEKRLGLHNS
jgi:hypothetical protein